MGSSGINRVHGENTNGSPEIVHSQSSFPIKKMKVQLVFLVAVALLFASQVCCEAAVVEDIEMERRYGDKYPGDACADSYECYVGQCIRGKCVFSGPGGK